MGASGAGERLVSREEQPVAINDPNARTLVPDSPPALSAPVTTEPGNTRPFPTPGGAAGEPKKVRTVTIRPEGSAGDTAPPAAAPSRSNAPAAAAPAVPAPARPLVQGRRRPRPASRSPPPPSSACAHPDRGRYAAAAAERRQLRGSDFRTEKSRQMRRLRSASCRRNILPRLGGRQPIIQRKESSKGVYYGTQVGPFTSRGDAIQLCEELKAAGGNCFVLRN